MVTRGSYVHNPMAEFSGHPDPENISFMQFSQKIDGFRQKTIHRVLELVQTLFISKTH